MARALSGKVLLPDQATMEEEIADYYLRLQARGLRTEDTHIQVRRCQELKD